jgi:uncharacterized RDD family membrane protein YckC
MAATAMRWCPRCGLSYVEGIQRCSDCLGDLVDEAPEGRRPRVEVRYDLGDWNDEQRGQLDALMRSGAIGGRWDGPELVVSEDVEEQVDGLIDFLEAGPGRTLWAPAASRAGRPAGPLPRIGGTLVDLLALIVVPLPFVALVPRGSTAAEVMLQAVYFSYFFVPVAIWGRTLGKIAARTKVVRFGSEQPPGWSLALARALVVGIPLALPYALGSVGEALSLGLLFTIYAPLLWRRDRRGLHDLASGTQVVHAD